MISSVAHRMRGFSLVEIAIILVVVGLLSSAIIIPSWLPEKEAVYERETRRLEDIRAAVFGYATRHRTREGAEARVSQDLDESDARVFALPGGRPFLPCPDITGDGYEDRADADETGFSAFAATITTFTMNDPADDVEDLAIRDFRRCESPRGVLPWRTLGVPPADHWGNLYSYYVDDVFADAQTGFNENTEADIYDPRTRISVVVNVEPPATPGGSSLTVTTNNHLYLERDVPPLAVCAGTVCESGMSLDLAAGRQAGAAFSKLFRAFEEHDIVEGASFAVWSHGENGRGAAGYERNFVAREAAMPGLICNPPILGSSGTAALTLFAAYEALNFPVVEVPSPQPGAMCQDATFFGEETAEGFIVVLPRTRGFDDVVLWVAREDLLDAMRRGGALPAPDFPALRPY